MPSYVKIVSHALVGLRRILYKIYTKHIIYASYKFYMYVWQIYKHEASIYMYTVEYLNNGQVGAGVFVRYSDVSFTGRFHHNYVNLILYQFMLKMVSYKFKTKSDSSRIDNLTPVITVCVVALDLEVKLSYPA